MLSSLSPGTFTWYPVQIIKLLFYSPSGRTEKYLFRNIFCIRKRFVLLRCCSLCCRKNCKRLQCVSDFVLVVKKWCNSASGLVNVVNTDDQMDLESYRQEKKSQQTSKNKRQHQAATTTWLVQVSPPLTPLHCICIATGLLSCLSSCLQANRERNFWGRCKQRWANCQFSLEG